MDFEGAARHLETKTPDMVEKLCLRWLEISVARRRASIARAKATTTPIRNSNETSRSDPDSPDTQAGTIRSKSEMTDSSSFSYYANPKRSCFHEASPAKCTRPFVVRGLPLGERSLASLTSGISDSAHISR